MSDDQFPLPEGEKSGEAGSGAAGKKDITKKTAKRVRGKNRVYRHVPKGRAYVQSSYNNTIVTFTDDAGDVLVTASAGQSGFRGPKKSTAYAAGIVVKNAITKVEPYGLQEVDVFVRGIGSGRDAAIRSLNAQGFNVVSIKDTTPIPHNGCRAPKVRRV